MSWWGPRKSKSDTLLSKPTTDVSGPLPMMAKLMPCDVYGHPDLVGSPLRAYVLGDFGPLLENPILSYPTPLLWLDPDRKTIHQFISHKDIGLWRYRLVPKHKHECCPDCGLDRHEIEELEKRVRSLEDVYKRQE